MSSMERPFKELRIYVLAEFISQTNDEMTRLDRLRNNMQVVTFASSHLRAALTPDDYEDLRLSADTLVEKIQRGQKGLSDRLTLLTMEASMRDFEAATREADEKDAGELRGRIARDLIKVTRLTMISEGASQEQLQMSDWLTDELHETATWAGNDAEMSIDKEWREAQKGKENATPSEG